MLNVINFLLCLSLFYRSAATFFKSKQRTVSVQTILNYIKARADTFLFFLVKRDDLQGKKLLTVNENIIYWITEFEMLFLVETCEVLTFSSFLKSEIYFRNEDYLQLLSYV